MAESTQSEELSYASVTVVQSTAAWRGPCSHKNTLGNLLLNPCKLFCAHTQTNCRHALRLLLQGKELWKLWAFSWDATLMCCFLYCAVVQKQEKFGGLNPSIILLCSLLVSSLCVWNTHKTPPSLLGRERSLREILQHRSTAVECLIKGSTVFDVKSWNFDCSRSPKIYNQHLLQHPLKRQLMLNVCDVIYLAIGHFKNKNKQTTT